MTARQHHYLSQCYLKGFVTDREKPRLFVVDAKKQCTFSTNPANVAVERDFHRIDVEGQPLDALENAFSGFETKLDDSLKRIIAARSIADTNDRAMLFNLIGLTAIKNPRVRENVRRFQDQTAKKIMEVVTSTPERWAAHVKRMQEEGTSPADPVTDYERMREFVRRKGYDLVIPPSEHLRVELKIFDEILPHIFNRKWILLRALPERTGFITSDHPMSLTWTDPGKNRGFWPPGLALGETQLLFPISNDLAIIGAFEFKEGESDADESLVGLINGRIIEHAARQIYARDDGFLYVKPPDPGIRRGAQLLSDLVSQRRSCEAC
jgi:Protein of unknown function (DUF4238)